jgi:hypothetical protein
MKIRFSLFLQKNLGVLCALCGSFFIFKREKPAARTNRRRFAHIKI